MTAPRRPLRPISRWWVIFGVAAVGAGIWASTWWLLDQTDGLSGAAEATARIDAIKTGLSVGAGTGGAVALLLAMRRQWLSERDQAHREQVADATQAHAERVASANEHDALERRITDLYVKAVDQLGSDRAAVRLGGLYALERLGQNHPGLRQTVVNVLCAYLRMPYTPPPEDAAPGDAELARSREELQVRHTAQDLLATHLRDEEYRGQRAESELPPTYWPGMSLDLSGAHLDGFSLIDCRVDSLECHDTRFAGEAMLRGLHCDLAFFQSAVFEGHTDFRGLNVEIDVWFSYSTFATEVWFHTDEFYPRTNLGHHAGFRGATFSIGARFNGATFSGSADFTDAEYEQGSESVNLNDVCIEDPNAVSPEIGNVPSTWPPGWVVQPPEDGTATLVRRAPRTPVETAS